MRIITAALVLAVAACGSDDGETGSTSGAGGSGTTSTSTTSSSSSSTSGAGGSGTGTGGGDVCGGTCVAPAPAGWEGPFEVFAAAGAPPDCDAGYDPEADVLADFVAPGGTCACDCGQPSGLSCGNEILHVSSDFSCSGSYNVTLTANQCFPNPPMGVNQWFTATGSKAQGGVCNAAVLPMLDVPSFSTSVRICGVAAPTSTGCDAGSVCAPARSSGAKLCVAQDGDVPCPAGYADRTVTYATFTDTRACPDASACSCTVDATCTGDLKTYVTTDCTSASYLYNALDIAVCLQVHSPLDGVAPGSIRATATPSGTCDSAGDLAPTGAVTPDAPRTLCCQP